MFKKSLAIILVGSMLVSAAPVMAAESEATSSVTSVAESVAESTENDVAAESTESAGAEETDEVDFRTLVETMVAEIEKAAAEVDLEKKEESLGKDFSEDGTVFSILENIVKDIEEKRTAEGKDLGDNLTQVLEALTNLDEAEEAEMDALLEEGIHGTDTEEAADDAEEEDPMAESIIANLVAGFVFEAAQENEQIAEAVEATGSNLFEILMGDETEEADTDLLDLVAEKPFEDFETELAKVTDYINEQEGPKQASLDLLNLVHEIVDDIHQSLHGHTHKAIVD